MHSRLTNDPDRRTSGRNVLLVSHDPATGEQLRKTLGRAGLDVIVSEDVEQGLFSALQKDVDAFLIDAELPEVGGVALCQRLRMIDRYQFTPTMMLTPSSEESHLEALFAAGADDFVTTPVNPTVLVARLRTQMQRMDYLHEVERVRANLNRYVSTRTQRLVEAYTVTGVLPGPEEREVCVMFVDVRGFAAMARQTKPTALFRMLSRHLGMQVDYVYQHAGYVDRLGGDGIVAIFDGNDMVIDACRCALDIVEASRQGPTHVDLDPVLPIGIGLHVGPVLIGNIGSSEHLDYSAIGETVNLAARLCGQADAMEVVVSEEVACMASAEAALELGDPREVNLKGLRDSMSVRALRRGSAARAPRGLTDIGGTRHDRRAAALAARW